MKTKNYLAVLTKSKVSEIIFAESPPDTLIIHRACQEREVLCCFNLGEKTKVLEVPTSAKLIHNDFLPDFRTSGIGQIILPSYSFAFLELL